MTDSIYLVVCLSKSLWIMTCVNACMHHSVYITCTQRLHYGLVAQWLLSWLLYIVSVLNLHYQ